MSLFIMGLLHSAVGQLRGVLRKQIIKYVKKAAFKPMAAVLDLKSKEINFSSKI